MGKTIGPKGNIQDVPAELFEETWRVNTGVHYLVCIRSCNGGFSFNTQAEWLLSLRNLSSPQWNPRNGDALSIAQGTP